MKSKNPICLCGCSEPVPPNKRKMPEYLTEHYKIISVRQDKAYWKAYRKVYSQAFTKKNKESTLSRYTPFDELNPFFKEFKKEIAVFNEINQLIQIKEYCETQGSHTPRQLKSIYYREHGKCNNCKVTLSFESLFEDHIVPLRYGGKDVKSNLQLLCQNCLYEKYRRPADLKLPKKKKIHYLRLKARQKKNETKNRC